MSEPELETVTSPSVLTPTQEKQANLTVLVMNLRATKLSEVTAKNNRIAIEEMIAEQIPGPEIGQVTETLESGQKIVVERGFNYRANLEQVRKAHAECDLDVPAPIKVKTTRELDVKGYEWYKGNQPEAFTQMAEFVTVTPKKTSVTLK